MANQGIFFEELLQDFDRHSASIEQLLKFSDAQLNAKTPAHEWSIGQQIDHLRLASEYFLKEIKKIEPTLKPGGNSEVSLSLIGRKIYQIGGANGNPNYPVPQYFVPKAQTYTKKDIETYFAITSEYKRLAKLLMYKDISSIKIVSPAVKLVKFNVPDIFSIFSNHGLRHMNQIDLIMRHPSFPQK